MRRISSNWTFFYKRIFPVFWFGFLALFVGVAVFNMQRSNPFAMVPFIVVPAGMFVFGLFFMRKFVFDLVDEVWDDGDALLVKNRGHDLRIPLKDIKNVNYSPLVNPPRVTLSLRRPTALGDEITFCAPVRFIPFAASPAITDLIDRVDRARSK